MLIKVIVPNKGYNEKAFGVHFHNGVGVFEDEAKGRQIAKRLGYEIEEEKKAPVKKAPKRKAPAKKEDKRAEE